VVHRKAGRPMPISESEFASLISSASTQVVHQERWPGFVTRIPNVEQVWTWREGENRGTMDVIRTNQAGIPFKADRWVLYRTRDGQCVIQGTTGAPDYGHHPPHLPGWPLRNSGST
jgi:hypothetical protein